MTSMMIHLMIIWWWHWWHW